MPPYTKQPTRDGWSIFDADGEKIAWLDTETMANALLHALLAPQNWADYTIGRKYESPLPLADS